MTKEVVCMSMKIDISNVPVSELGEIWLIDGVKTMFYRFQGYIECVGDTVNFVIVSG